MRTKQFKSVDRERLVDDVHKAARCYIEGGGGKVVVIGPTDIVKRRAMEFDLVIKCVGQPPKWE